MIRKIINISLTVILCIFLTVLTILGLAFTFIEGRMLFSLEWTVYHNPFNACVRLTFKLLLAISLIVYSVFEIINLFKKKDIITHSLYGVNVGYAMLGILLFITAANYVDLAGLILLPTLLVLKTIMVFITKRYASNK